VLVLFVDTRGVQIKSSMEEFVQGTEQRSEVAKSKDAPTTSNKEEFVSDMERNPKYVAMKNAPSMQLKEEFV